MYPVAAAYCRAAQGRFSTKKLYVNVKLKLYVHVKLKLYVHVKLKL